MLDPHGDRFACPLVGRGFVGRKGTGGVGLLLGWPLQRHCRDCPSVLTFLEQGLPGIDTLVRVEKCPGCPLRVSCWGDVASMKKTSKQVPAQEEAGAVISAEPRPEGRGHVGPRRPQAQSGSQAQAAGSRTWGSSPPK